MDSDKMDRMSSPIYLENDDLGFNNRLNSYMDHGWDGFYTSQKRLSRWPGMVYQKVPINIEYTGTPPNVQRFKLNARDSSPGVHLTLKYNAAGAYTVWNDDTNKLIETNDWDDNAKTWGAVVGTGCGENRYEGVINRLQFYITPGCTLRIKPRDAIMLAIRMEWTMEEFWADGGVTRFSDRLAGVLGIHRADVKVVAVYEGSVIIEFQITNEEDDAEELAKTETKFREMVLSPNAGAS